MTGATHWKSQEMRLFERHEDRVRRSDGQKRQRVLK